jgi:hypothetical protein
MTPTLPDQNWGAYADSFGANSSPLASYYNQSYDNDQLPRGAFPCFVQVDRLVNGVFVDHSNISTGVAGETFRAIVFTSVCEPLFISPFTYGDPVRNRQGMAGINNMSFTLNVNSTLNRLASCIVPAGASVAISAGVPAQADVALPEQWSADSQLFRNAYASPAIVTSSSGGPTIRLRLLSSQPSDRLEPRNVVPYFDLPRYLTSNANNLNLGSRQTRSISSQSIQLSQLPDYFIIVARKPVVDQTVGDTSSFLSIRNISINLNNQSGLLSSASTQDLWRMSVKNGSQQAWPQFSGEAFVYSQAGNGAFVPTTGSMFMVSPTDLSLPDYLTSGSLGAFQLQFQVSVYNQFDETVPNVELCVIACNSGIFVLQQGTANVYTGILTREAVLKAKEQKPVDDEDRMIGGANFLNSSMAKHKRHVKHMSAGAMSGGAVSAGARPAMSRLHGMY